MLSRKSQELKLNSDRISRQQRATLDTLAGNLRFINQHPNDDRVLLAYEIFLRTLNPNVNDKLITDAKYALAGLTAKYYYNQRRNSGYEEAEIYSEKFIELMKYRPKVRKTI